MKNQLDELPIGLAQSVTRRAALKKFGVGLAGMTLAVLGMGSKSEAAQNPCQACLQGCFDYYQSRGYSRRAAGPLCDVQCALPCSKKPF